MPARKTVTSYDYQTPHNQPQKPDPESRQVLRSGKKTEDGHEPLIKPGDSVVVCKIQGDPKLKERVKAMQAMLDARKFDQLSALAKGLKPLQGLMTPDPKDG